MKKHATTIVLVLVAGLLVLFWWLDRDRVTEGEKHRRENNVFTAWRREELGRIEVARTGSGDDAETLVLERDAKHDGPWRLTSPRAERADQQAVEKLLSTLELAIVQRKATGDGALGLETPRARGTLTMGGLVVHFALGGPSPRPEGSSYFQIDGGAPFVVSKDLTKTLLSGSDTYRDRTVVPYLSLELAELAVIHGQGGLVLEHLGGRWFRLAQAGIAASRAGAERIWAALAELRAESFPKDADADKLTSPPTLTLRLVPRDGRPPAEILFGAACPGHPDDVVVLRTKPTRVAACAPKGVVDALRVAPGTLVEKRPFLLEADEIEELRFERVEAAGDAGVAGAGPAKIDLARKGSGWRARLPLDRDLAPGEAEAVSELVSRLAASPAPVAGRDSKDAPFTVVARVVARAGDHEEVVEVGRPDAAGVALVRRTFDMARLEVPAAVARMLLPRETVWRSRVLLGEESRPATRVRLLCGATQELVDAGEGLRLVEPSGFETDGAALSVVEAFAKGKVDRWVADADDGSFGLATSTCRVVLGFADKNLPRTVVLGAEGEGGIYGAVEGVPGVFVAPVALRDVASSWYVSRATLRADASAISAVRVLRGGAAGVVAAPEALREAAAGLYADAVLAVGKEAAKLVPSPDLELEVKVADEKAPRLVRCAKAPPAPRIAAPRHACVRDGVAAAFAVADTRLAPFTGLPAAAARAGDDAGVARDAGSR